ncbi:MAG: hypothetical protein Kow0065_24280 [Methylomicrobium sp.]
MKIKTQWSIHTAIMLMPLSVPITAGSYWLWINHLLIVWVGCSAALGVGWWLIYSHLDCRQSDLELLDISESLGHTPRDLDAYRRVEEIAAKYRKSHVDLGSLEFYSKTLIEVMQAVAEEYHPQRKDALLEIKIPYLLKIVEKIAQDLRMNISETIPASHIVSINDLIRTGKLAGKGIEIYRLFRLVAAGFDPVSAAIRELKLFATKDVLTQSKADIKCWLIDAYIKKIGFYAIELYSEKLLLDEPLSEKTTYQSQHELHAIHSREQAIAREPFRILVIGQTNAGKSSLVNGIVGQLRAETDVLPSNEGTASYLLHRPGLDKAIILDCQGYDRIDASKSSLSKTITRHYQHCDMIVVAISAVNAARDPDKKTLSELRRQFSMKADASMPPIIVALTHIDRLRPFREWRPPYNVFNPASEKERAIRLAMETVADELELSIDQIVPVNLKAGCEYNVEEGLIAAMFQQLGRAEQVRYLRCLKAHRKEDQWRLLWSQSQRAGCFIAKNGWKIFDSIPNVKTALS